MELGYTTMNTPEDPDPATLARGLEERGYGSLWIGEHSHIPVSRRTPYPAGGEMPEQYTRMMDPFVSLTVAATASDRLLLATGVALPLEHDLFALAKSVATLDVVSGGRFVFGVGVGWNVEELADHRPVPWPQRYRALAYVLSGLITSIGGILLSARLGRGDIGAGNAYLLQAVAAALIGFAVLGANRPNAFGTVIGALFVGVLFNGLTMFNVPYYAQDFIQGALLVLTLVVTYTLSDRVPRRRPRADT